MRNVVGICGALFVVALIFLVVAEGPAAGAVLDAFWAQPFAAKLAWMVVGLVPLFVIPAAVWLGETLTSQRQAARALELRLAGVRQNVKSLAKSQSAADAAVGHLTLTDPEDAMSILKQRLAEAERTAQIQKGRNQVGDLNSRVEDIRAQQQALQKRLAPVLEKRRAIEQLFAELDGRQTDIDHALAEVVSGQDAVALDIELRKMTDFVGQSVERCDAIERAAKIAAGLREEYAALQARLAPHTAAADGVATRLKELTEMRDQLADEIGAMEQTPQGALAARVQKIADDKKTLGDRVAELDAQFARLTTLRKDVDGVFATFDRMLDTMFEKSKNEEEVDVDARVRELAAFIEVTQARLGDIERRAASFADTRTKLNGLQMRLAPLEARDGGLVQLMGDLREARDRLAAKIKQIEEDDGGLDERVKKFSAARQELEDRVTSLTGQFDKLTTIQKDIAGLSDKLSSAANPSAN